MPVCKDIDEPDFFLYHSSYPDFFCIILVTWAALRYRVFPFLDCFAKPQNEAMRANKSGWTLGQAHMPLWKLSSLPTLKSLIGDNYKWWWQNSNIGDPLSCLVGKHKPFGKQISFLAWKKNPNPSAQDFQNTMGNPFFWLC